MDLDTQGRDATGRPIHRACLVAGCPCRTDGSVSDRRPAHVAAAAAPRGESAGPSRLPELAWRFAGLPVA